MIVAPHAAVNVVDTVSHTTHPIAHPIPNVTERFPDVAKRSLGIFKQI